MQLHYFQRYHGKENVVTSNVMLMLSRLYDYSPSRFFEMLNDNFLDSNESPEVSFMLQPANSNTIPDAAICQKSFKIVIETKLHNQFSKAQLMGHLHSFENEELKVLMTIDARPMDPDLKRELDKEIEDYNKENDTCIFHRNITFKDLLDMIVASVDERDIDMQRVVQDFSNYCHDEQLIPDSENYMRVIAAGTTLKDNIDLGLYYDQASRGYSNHGYIGLYNKKTVKAIGKLIKVVTATPDGNGDFLFATNDGAEVTQDEKDAYREAVRRGEKYNYTESLNTYPHNVFYVDKFYLTDFKKTTPYGIMKSKFFNLKSILNVQQLPSTEEIAEALRGRTWEDVDE